MKIRSRPFMTISALFILGGTILFLLLPYLCDSYLLPRVLAALPFSEKNISLTRISPWEVRGVIELADQGHPAISIPRFILRYSPADMVRGKFTSLLIDSATLHADLRKGHPIIYGLPPSPPGSSPLKEKPTPKNLLPVAIETVIVKNLFLVIQLNDKKVLHLNADGRLMLDYLDETAGSRKLLSSVNGQLQTTGDLDLAVSAKIDAKADGYEIGLAADARDISQITALLPAGQHLQTSGTASIDASAKLNSQIQISKHEARVQVNGLRAAGNGFVIESESSEKPVMLSLAGNMDESRYKLANVILLSPEKVRFDSEGEVQLKDKLFSGQVSLHVERTQTPVTIDFSGGRASFGARVEYQIQSKAITLGKNLVAVSPIRASGFVEIKDSVISGDIKSKIARITESSSGTALVDTTLQLPFVFPLQDEPKGPEGRLNIAEIRFRKKNSARLQASLFPSSAGLSFTALLSTPLATALQLTCKGTVTPDRDLSIGCKLPAAAIDASALPPQVGLKHDLDFDGKVSAEAIYTIQDGLHKGSLSVGFHQGNLRYGQTTLQGIDLDVVFPRLPLLQSSPSQVCTVDSMKAGQIHITDGAVRFRVEDESSVFIEKSRFKWCAGRVETTGFRLSKKMKELETTLYCDRLKFTELLGQLGIEGAEGQGSLNGRLPLSFNSGGLTFDDGFLFSTPGNGGIVRFNNTKQLRQGVPNINQSAYLDYSMQALENFSYNWTKLTFNSEQHELLIAMQLDGKPAEPLPFAYRDGQIVPSAKGPGIAHPIRLDINFRLPLQEMFQYGKNIQSIMENM